MKIKLFAIFPHLAVCRHIATKVLFAIAFLFLSFATVSAQVTGTVKDTQGEPIVGATLIEKGTANGTITDIDGNFSLSVSQGATLVVSFVGMVSQEVVVNGAVINVSLETSTQGIDEVVVVGYGTIRKSDLTGAVSSVNSEDMEKLSVGNAGEALQGRIAGVSVQSQDGGAPGGNVNIRIRGLGTIGNNNPLYIVDGLPGSLSLLNPDDIESIEVLKDASACAIYGSRAANGVVLITTKNGKEGKTSVEVSGVYGVQNLTNTIELTDAADYISIASMAYQNAGIELPLYLAEPVNVNTNWFDEIFQQGVQQNYNMRVSGANNFSNYNISGSYFDQQGTMIGTSFNKASLRAKTSITKGIFSVDANLSYTEANTDEQSLKLRETYQIIPLIPVFDENQPSGYGLADIDNGMPSSRNPVGDEKLHRNDFSDNFLTAYFTTQLKPTNWLNYTMNLGLNNSQKYWFTHNPPNTIDIKDPDIYANASEQRLNWKHLVMEHILSYSQDFEKHSISLIAAYTAEKEYERYSGVAVAGYTTVYEVDEGGNLVVTEQPAGFIDPNFNTLDAGQGGTYSGWGTEYTYTRLSMLSRFNYSYDNRYLLQLTVRRDGTSKFGENSRFGVFPAISAGWKLKNEKFLVNNDFISDLKLRASYGLLGNEGSLENYYHQALIRTNASEFYVYSQGTGETHWVGAIARDLENKNYKWEEMSSLNIGVDFGFLNGKIEGAVNYYKNQTYDMLVRKPVPASAGISTPVVNVGKVQNSGVEFELGYRNYDNPFKYSVNVTLSSNQNEVLALGDTGVAIYGEALNYDEHYPTQTRIGSPIGAFYLYQTDGIFQTEEEVLAYTNTEGELLQPLAAPGDIRFKDTNNDGVIDEDDKVFAGTGIPKLEYSLSLNAEYKGFDFYVLFIGAAGHKLYNGNRYYLERMSTNYNFSADMVNAWTPENTDTDVPRAIIGDPNQNSRESMRFLEDGDFIRLKNIQLGYTLPTIITNKIHAENFRIYVSAQNLLTFTNYTGLDPEVSRSNIFNPGLDRTLYPIAKTYLMGFQLTF